MLTKALQKDFCNACFYAGILSTSSTLFPVPLFSPDNTSEKIFRIMKNKLYSSIHIFNHLHIILLEWRKRICSALDIKNTSADLIVRSALFLSAPADSDNNSAVN